MKEMEEAASEYENEDNGWSKSRFVSFMAAVEAGNSYKNMVIIFLGVIIVVLAVLLFNAQSTITSMARNIPVMVIPGARSGLYSPGISAENVKNLAIYMVKLPLDITPKNIEQRYNEFESFLSPGELMNFQAQKTAIIQSIQGHDESRIFVADTYHLKEIGVNQYKIVTTGHYHYFSGNLVLGDHKERVSMTFTVAVSASPKNPYGVVINSFRASKVSE